MDVYTTLHYDAMAVGPNDLASGLDLLTEAFVNGTPWVSANLTTPSGRPLFSPWIVKNIGSIRTGIIGVTGEVLPTPEYIARSWQDTLPQYIDELTASCDFIIMLSTLEKKENEEIADRFPQIQLFITADSLAGNMAPLLRKNSLFTQTHTRGKYLGILDVSWHNTVLWQGTLAESPSLIQKLADLYEARLEAATPDGILKKSVVDHLHNNLQTLTEMQSDLQKYKPGTYAFRFRSLPDHIKKNARVDERLNRLKQDIASGNKMAHDSDPISTTSGSLASLKIVQAGFAGSERCGKCHENQFAQWKKSGHAHALASLEKEQQQYNLHCLGCHVTWNRSESSDGTIKRNLLELPKTLANVGCESCHGPGLKHVDSKGKYADFKTITKSICTSCHTPEMDAHFDYATRLSRLGCQQ